MSAFTEHLAELHTPHERRFYPRVEPSAQLHVDLGVNHQSPILNVSENGLLVSAPFNISCNFVARVLLQLNGLPKAIQVHVRVVWTSEAQRRVGMQLLDLSEYDREQIRKWEVLNRRSRAEAAPVAERERPATVAALPSSFVKPRNRRSPLEVSIWAAVPIVAAFVIILLLRTGALHNPLLPSAGSTEDTNTSTQIPAETPRIEQGNLPHSQRDVARSALADGLSSTTSLANSDDRDAHLETKSSPLSSETAPTNLTQRVDELSPNSTIPLTVVPYLAGSRTAITQLDTHRTAGGGNPTQELSGSSAASSSIPDNSSSASVRSDGPSNAIVASTRPPIPAARGGSFLARKSDPNAVQRSDSELIDVRPQTHQTSFLALPGESVLDSADLSMRIQRSVLVPGNHKWWPFHRDKKIALGDLVFHVAPQVSQPSSGPSPTVTVQATVAKDGHIENVQPIYGSETLVSPVLAAVHAWRFQPTLIDGKSVETQADIEVRFHASGVKP